MEESPEQRKSCYDCKFLYSRVNWWCGNEDAIKYRGTRIPGVIHCPYWEIEPSINQKRKTMKFYRCFSNIRRWCEGTYGILELKLLLRRNWPTDLPRTYVINIRWKKFCIFYKLYESQKKFTRTDIAFCFAKGLLFLFIHWVVCTPMIGLLLLIAALSDVLSSCFEWLSDFIRSRMIPKSF